MNNKQIINISKEFCTGCGLCGSVENVSFNEDIKGFLYPDLKSQNAILCSNVCPAMGKALRDYAVGSIWGHIDKSYLGWSQNSNIRQGSSSGGILTSICLYLLENKLVDGVIQTIKSEIDKRRTETVISRTREDVLKCMGSRYTTSSPLKNVKQLIRMNERYAFVGKPCDVSALRMYKELRKEDWTLQIKYLFSFFCAGQPSLDANNKLIKVLGCDDISDCKDIQYRGDGWPGNAKVMKSDGSVKAMDYETSWMTILGRDVRRCCRFCADGTGEMADISCGDAWYLNENGKPDFTERPGRNVIFARTEKGTKLIEAMASQNLIQIEDFDPEIDGLRKMQPYHYARKASLSSLKIAMKLCCRQFPCYDKKKLLMFSKDFPLRNKIYRCLGTIQRVLKKKL